MTTIQEQFDMFHEFVTGTKPDDSKQCRTVRDCYIAGAAAFMRCVNARGGTQQAFMEVSTELGGHVAAMVSGVQIEKR